MKRNIQPAFKQMASRPQIEFLGGRIPILARAVIEAIEPRVFLSSYTLNSLPGFTGNSGALPGSDPQAPLTLDASGDLFGTTVNGGTYGYGTVFEIAKGTNAVTNIASFTGSSGALIGTGSDAALTLDASGNLFGTGGGGTSGDGTVFEIAKGTNAVTNIASFTGSSGALLGADPDSALTLDSSGDLFGATIYGGSYGYGTIFEIAKGSSAVTNIAGFTGRSGALPGYAPYAALTLDASGNLFGTTEGGGSGPDAGLYGAPNGDGTVFEIAKGTNAVTHITSFTGTSGAVPGEDPDVALTLDASGNLFGTTGDDGGSVFEIAEGSKSVTNIANFTGNSGALPGAYPEAALTLDANGNLFGTTYAGGSSDDGSIFEIANGSKSVTNIASFTGASGALQGSQPQTSLTLDASGNLFGTIGVGNSYGTVFEIANGRSDVTNIASFIGSYGPLQGGPPSPTLTVDASGDLFGSTQSGGSAGDGTVFELFVPQLAFIQGPINSLPATTISPAVTVAVEDAAGAIQTGDASSVTLSISSGTLSGTLTEPVVNGVATFSDLSVSAPGTGYTLSATDIGDGVTTPVVSAPFSIGNLPIIDTDPTASGIIYGQTLASSELSGGSANTPGTFAFTTPTTAPGAGTPMVSVTFTPLDTTDYISTTITIPVSVAQATPGIDTNPIATGITYGQTLASSMLIDGSASTPGTFAFTAPTTMPGAGVPSESVTFTPSDTVDYTTATTNVTVAVAKAGTSVTMTAPASGPYTGNAFAATNVLVNGVATLEAVTPTVNYYSGSSVNPTNLLTGAPKNAGTYTVQATFAGSADYANSSSAAVTFAISKVTLTPTLIAVSKLYDGTTADPGASIVFSSGVAAGDSVGATFTAAFASTGIGSNITVTATGITLTGASAGNYTLSTTTAHATASILLGAAPPLPGHTAPAPPGLIGPTTPASPGAPKPKI